MAIFKEIRSVLCRVLPSKGTCLFYWQPAQGNNFGDELSRHIVSRLLQSSLGSMEEFHSCIQHRCFKRRLFAIGSILHECRSGDTIWGSGINGKIGSRNYSFAGVDFRAVRGPLTRELILKHGGECPPVFGDPGLLVARVFPELTEIAVQRDEQKVSFIPNFNDAVVSDQQSIKDTNVNYVSPLSHWKDVVDEIRSSSFVVASSLHGIVLSDSFGVPCRPFFSLFEAPFKFEDYFLATGRTRITYARSVEEALELGPIPAAKIDLDPLLDAFPAEIFRTDRDQG